MKDAGIVKDNPHSQGYNIACICGKLAIALPVYVGNEDEYAFHAASERIGAET